MSKTEYPRLEIGYVKFEASDIITTSQAFQGEWVPIEVAPIDNFIE